MPHFKTNFVLTCSVLVSHHFQNGKNMYYEGRISCHLAKPENKGQNTCVSIQCRVFPTGKHSPEINILRKNLTHPLET